MSVAKRDVFEDLEKSIDNLPLSETDKASIFTKLLAVKNTGVNIMIVGSTGCGKSSTINAMFDTDEAKIGVGVDPETMNITKYELNGLVLWDSPGLGDSPDKDKEHAERIIKKLKEKGNDGNALIDLVLIILDGTTRDYGTSFDLINNIIIPTIGDDAKNRILVAINQADVAMKGRYWDKDKNEPEPELIKFLKEKVNSVRKRIKDSTGVDIEPIYYCAGYKEDGEEQKPYNLSKLFYFIIQNTSSEKRLIYVNNRSSNKSSWESNESYSARPPRKRRGSEGIAVGAHSSSSSSNKPSSYNEAIETSFASSVVNVVSSVVKGVANTVVSAVKGLWNWLTG